MKKNFLKAIQTLFIFSLAFTLTSCWNFDNPLEDLEGSGSGGGGGSTTVKVTSITLDKTSLPIHVGDADVTLTATVEPDDATDKAVTWSSDKTAVATVDEAGKVHAVAIGTAIITATAKDGSGIKATCNVSVLPAGALAGIFSVSATKTVWFSQGNLQYQASPSKWRFAENQYDYVGDNTVGNVYVETTKSDNASISSSYTGWIDLFGWGTSGYDHGATCYQPYSTSTTSPQYYAYGDKSKTLYDDTGKADWGYNIISNGGNEENFGWRTLTKDEWVYLFNRTVNGGTGEHYSYTLNQEIFGKVKGIVLYPDNYKGAEFTGGPSSVWATFEAAGCVFLPFAGRRTSGTSVAQASTDGHYWSSTPGGTYDTEAYQVSYASGTLKTDGHIERSNGLSVRLVYNAQ